MARFKKPGFGAPPGTAPEGTGIVITTSGHILTASYVINRANKIEIRDINGNKFDADLIFNDIKTDLAIIKAEINIVPIKISTKKPQTLILSLQLDPNVMEKNQM